MSGEVPIFELGGDGQEWVALVMTPDFARTMSAELLQQAEYRKGRFSLQINCTRLNSSQGKT